MIEIEFSVMEAAPGDAERLLPLLAAFESQYHVHVNLVGIPWDKGWTDIAKFGIYGHGPDVSAIGTTWIGSLAAMQALRAFTPQEVSILGGAQTFFEPVWRTGFLPNDPTPWAIPWLGDAKVFYYWKDAFKKAGIENFESAVSSGPRLMATLEKLRQSGNEFPLAATTNNVSVVLHEAAHWIWSAGGEIINAERTQVVFDQPAAMRGLHDYFSLRPYISPKSLSLTSATTGILFHSKEALVCMGGSWEGIAGRAQNPDWNENLGIVVPDKTYVGGASFVIWGYSRKAREAFDLIHFLSSQPSSIPASPLSSELPTKRDAAQLPSLQTDRFQRAFIQAMQVGRSFPSLRLWGSIEDKLIAGISETWQDLFNNPDQDLDECLHRHLDPLAKRLNMVLGN